MLSCWIRWPHGVLHLQPRLCHLLLGGVLLPAVHHHPAGLHSHLHLPQDEAEEDRLWPGQWKSAAGLSSTIGGEKLLFNCPISTDITSRFSRKASLRSTAALSSTATITKKQTAVSKLEEVINLSASWWRRRRSHLVSLHSPHSSPVSTTRCYKSPPYLPRVIRPGSCLSKKPRVHHQLHTHRGAAIYRPIAHKLTVE